MKKQMRGVKNQPKVVICPETGRECIFDKWSNFDKIKRGLYKCKTCPRFACPNNGVDQCPCCQSGIAYEEPKHKCKCCGELWESDLDMCDPDSELAGICVNCANELEEDRLAAEAKAEAKAKHERMCTCMHCNRNVGYDIDGGMCQDCYDAANKRAVEEEAAKGIDISDGGKSMGIPEGGDRPAVTADSEDEPEKHEVANQIWTAMKELPRLKEKMEGVEYKAEGNMNQWEKEKYKKEYEILKPEYEAAVKTLEELGNRWDNGGQPKVEVKPEPKVEVKPEPKVEPKEEPKVEVKPEPKVEVKPEPKVEPKEEPKVEVKPEPAKPQEAKPKTPAAAKLAAQELKRRVAELREEGRYQRDEVRNPAAAKAAKEEAAKLAKEARGLGDQWKGAKTQPKVEPAKSQEIKPEPKVEMGNREEELRARAAALRAEAEKLEAEANRIAEERAKALKAVEEAEAEVKAANAKLEAAKAALKAIDNPAEEPKEQPKVEPKEEPAIVKAREQIKRWENALAAYELKLAKAKTPKETAKFEEQIRMAKDFLKGSHDDLNRLMG